MTRKKTTQYSDSSIFMEPASSPAGFSLIEVVLAMAILSIGILCAMQLGLLAKRNISTGNIVTQAVLLAQTEIEKIKTHRSLIDLKDTFSVDPDPQDYLNIAYQFIDPLAEEVDRPISENCETSDYSGSGTCLAMVTVSWKRGGGGRGGRGEVQLKTLVGSST